MLHNFYFLFVCSTQLASIDQALWSVSAKEGKLLWGIATDKLQLPCLTDSVFRSAQLAEDLSGDKIPDILVGIKGEHIAIPDPFKLG